MSPSKVRGTTDDLITKKATNSRRKSDTLRKGGKKKSKQTFGIYIYKVLKQSHPDIGISQTAMSVMDSFVFDIFERLATEASRLAALNGKRTLSSSEIQTAVRLMLPNDLGLHAIREATKALSNYIEGKKRK